MTGHYNRDSIVVCFQVEQEEKRIQASLQALLEDEKMAHDGMLPTQITKPKTVSSE